MEEDQIMTDSSDCLSLSNLPSNVISKIVRKLPVSYRKNFALTCKDFYKIVCHEDRFKHKMKVDSAEKLFDVYDSVMASKRIFDEIILQLELSEQTLDLLTNIAALHGSAIKKLTLEFQNQHNTLRLKASQFQAFIEEFTNLNEFAYAGSLEFDGEPEAVLQNVKTIKSRGWHHNILKFIQPNTIVSCDNYERDLSMCPSTFLERQRNVKRIFFDYYASSTDFKHLKLENIQHRGRKGGPFTQIIRDHAKTLKEINVLGIVKSQTLDLICNHCTNLESLALFVAEENVTNLFQISRLKKLKELRLVFCDEATLASLKDVAQIEIMSINKLDLRNLSCDEYVSEDIFGDIGKNWTNIEELKVNELLLPINKVLLRFKKLKSVDFSSYMLFCNYDGHVHPGIEKLQCFSYRKFNLPPCIMHALPNLKSLEVTNCDFYGPSELKALNGMKRLKELKIKFLIELDDLILNSEDIEELKKLMHRLEVCEIQFCAPNNFIDDLAERLKGEVFEIGSDEKSLCIKIRY